MERMFRFPFQINIVRTNASSWEISIAHPTSCALFCVQHGAGFRSGRIEDRKLGCSDQRSMMEEQARLAFSLPRLCLPRTRMPGQLLYRCVAFAVNGK